MNVEEFEKAAEKELREKANEYFSKLDSSGSGDWAAHLLTAKFYMDEVERREQEKERRFDRRVSTRDLALEIIVIFLIGLEIVFGYFEEKEQMSALHELNLSAGQTAKTLTAVREAQEGTLNTLNATLRPQVDLLTRQWNMRLEEESRKPAVRLKLEVNSKLEDTIVRKDTKNDFYLVLGNENSATFTFSIQNSGNAPIKRPKALIASDSGTISFQCTRNASEFEQKCLIEPTFDMMPYAQVGLWNDFTVVAKIPVEVHDFTIYFSIWGDNAKEFTDRTKVTVILKYWWTFEDSEKAYEK